MPVSLVTLLNAAAFKEETKEKLIAFLDKLTEAQKFELSNTCWSVLAQTYFARLRYERTKLLSEIQEAKRKFDKKDFDEVKNKVTKEFAQKLQSAETEGEIEEVRSELQKHLSQPVSQKPT